MMRRCSCSKPPASSRFQAASDESPPAGRRTPVCRSRPRTTFDSFERADTNCRRATNRPRSSRAWGPGMCTGCGKAFSRNSSHKILASILSVFGRPSLHSFSIRDLLLVTVIAALAVGWWVDHRREEAEKRRMIKDVDELLGPSAVFPDAHPPTLQFYEPPRPWLRAKFPYPSTAR